MKILMILFMFVVFIDSSHAQIDTTTYETLTDSVFVVGDRILVRDIGFSQRGGYKLLDKSFNCLDSVRHFNQKAPGLSIFLPLRADLFIAELWRSEN
jgi:hypothetical protein